MRLLNGSDLAGFIQERQARQVRALRQAGGVQPRLAIVLENPTPVIDTYIRLKQNYGADILVDVTVHTPTLAEAPELIATLNADPNVHGIIVQLPLSDPAQTDILVNAVLPAKDVDGLGAQATMEPATPMAILWLLAGYNVELKGKKIVVVGKGRLVGQPLAAALGNSGLDVTVVDKSTTDLAGAIRQAEVIITGVGVPNLITSDMVSPNAVVVDAGVASEGGKLYGDLAEDIRLRNDLTITPLRGGVGPLTVCALFDNVIRAASGTAGRIAEQ